MKSLLIIIALLYTYTLAAQKQNFDLATYTPPTGWKKELQGNSAVKYTITKGNSYCLLIVYKSETGSNDIDKDFKAEWDELTKNYQPETAPQTEKGNSKNGWQNLNAVSTFTFEGGKSIILLSTYSGFGKRTSVLVLTNDQTYLAVMDCFLAGLVLSKPSTGTPVTTNPQPIATSNNKYKFTTTNFDDGWIAVEKEDWVEVTKGNIKVLLHYPQKGTVFPADPGPLTNAAWNILVAPRYSNLKNYKTSYVSSYIRGYLGMGYMQDNATKSDVFVLLFRQSDGWIEFICPDKKTFIQQFKYDPESMRWDTEIELVKPLDAMSSYNKFAVAASDLNGTGLWSSSFASNTFYTNIYTGNSAGMSTYTSGEDYTFLAGQKFKWSLVAANSHSGTTNFAQDKAEGVWKMNNDWEIGFNKSGRAKRYSAYFSCIKGTRLLHLLDADYRGSGVYTIYGKK